jgi:ABC-type transport system involved in multi-copper enzyme maturation permease subunit
MLTVLKHTLIESIHKRMALALLVISVLIFSFTLYFFRLQTQPDGKVLVFTQGGKASQPAEGFVREYLASTLMTTAGPWTLLGIFALAPLLSSYLETGMAGLLFTKALARWQIFLGRVGGAFTLFVATLVVLDGLPSIYFWLRTGVSSKPFLIAVSILALSFLSIVATMALVTLQRRGPAPAIIIAFLQITLSGVLAERAMILRMFNAKWFAKSLDYAYYVLPKNSDLTRAAQSYMTTGHITNLMPLWSTALFTAVVLAFSIFQLQRKSL